MTEARLTNRTVTPAVLALVLSAAAARCVAGQETSLLRDATFDAYRAEAPGPWEFRYGHKGGQYANVRPRWQVESSEDSAEPGAGPHLLVGKAGAAAGTVFIGQRVRLPDPVPPVDLGITFQCFCQADNRSGMVDLCVFTPELWGRMARAPEQATELPPRGDVFHQPIKGQGPDVIGWTLGRVSSSQLRAALRQHAGEDVVVAVYCI